ncbi:MAG: hypothetical protein RIC35_06600 [Marinoscillum sp.]
MLSGHFAPALLAHEKQLPKGTMLYFLVASQLQDLLWLVFHYFGLEPTLPVDALNVTLESIAVDMLYSHDLYPQIAWLFIVFLAGKVFFKSTKLGLIGAAITLSHILLDLVAGYPHHLFGEHTHNIGLGLYVTNVYLAILIEALFIGVLLYFFFKRQSNMGLTRSRSNKLSIIGVFAGGVLFILFIASISLRTWFGIPEFAIPINTTIPVLMLTYWGLVFYLNHLISRYSLT